MTTAVGKQLDILATYRGATRFVYGLDLTRAYFSTPFALDASPGAYPGFGFSLDSNVPDYFLQASDFNLPTYAMTDDELARLIRLKAKVQSRFLSIQEIDAILLEFFGTNLIATDNGDMTMTYTHNPADLDNLYTIAKGTNSLPHPAGVQLIFA